MCEILPPPAGLAPTTNAARALVGRLVHRGDVSPELLTLVDGPLAEALSRRPTMPVSRSRRERSLPTGATGAILANGRGGTGSIRRCCRYIRWWSRPGWRRSAPALGPSALRRRVAAIAWHHRSLGHTWQAGHAAIRQTLSGIGREPSPAGATGGGADLDGRQAADCRLPRKPGRARGSRGPAGPCAVPRRPRRRLPALGAGGDRCRPSAV